MVIDPFPHMVSDEAVPDYELAKILNDWPADGWKQYQHGKRATHCVKHFPIVRFLLTREFVASLERMTGIPNLIADESLFGGGLHEIQPGGSLGIHVDFNRLGSLYRRVNLLIFLNRDWKPEWGGALELWRDIDGSPGELARTIEPEFNRSVTFIASEKSWHGHPKPLACPEGVTRKSLAFYYYTEEKPEWFTENHSTIYKDVPCND